MANAFALLDLGNGEYVFQRRDMDAPTSPGLISFFGGSVEEGEDADGAIRRELGEETSLDIGSLAVDHVLSTDYLRQGTNVQQHADLFRVMIQNADFEVYEGVGSEVYDLTSLLARDDVAPSTRHITGLYIQQTNVRSNNG